MPESLLQSAQQPVTTWIAGLDLVLGGGLTPHRLYLIEGVPGCGKATKAHGVGHDVRARTAA